MRECIAPSHAHSQVAIGLFVVEAKPESAIDIYPSLGLVLAFFYCAIDGFVFHDDVC